MTTVADRFYLDRPGVESNADSARTTQDRLGDAVRTLREVLTRRDGCWGTDDIGKAFGNEYKPAETDVLVTGDEMAVGFADYAAGLDAYAEKFSQIDEDNAARLDRLNAQGIRGQQRD
ncbi:hypothetical protein HX744_06175 [Pseudonocardia sp. ICBG1122]|nr:hypothetical protein [Pseudonocardia pini]